MSENENQISLKDARILIIDDDLNCVRRLTMQLEAENYTNLLGLTDARQALERVATFQPDLILLDWHMEPFSGLAFVQGMSGLFPAAELPPVIVMTGDTFPETRDEALHAGVSDFLTKPLDHSEVILRIQNHLRLWRLRQHVQSEKERLEEKVHARTAQLRSTIAELKEVQHQVISEERMRALSAMAGGVAHDFNNALMVIRGYSELYAQREEITAAEMRKGFEIIALASQDAAEIVRRLREFYRPFSKQEDTRHLLNLNTLVRESLDLACPKWKTQCQASGLCVTVEEELSAVPEVWVTPSEIREVLLNLIFNAVDAMPQGGRIAVRTRATKDSVLVEVEDSGTGMTNETRDRCFEPFYSTKGQRGTGLGLAIAYGILQRHGGSIAVRTELNRGTCFTLTVPIGQAEEASPTNILHLPTLQHLRILVVDDDPHICSVISHYLETDEHSVTVASNGCEALEKFGQSEFDVVITDRVMPKMSGDQLASAIRELKPKEPIILLSGFEARAGAEVVGLPVSKPASLATLREALSRVVAA